MSTLKKKYSADEKAAIALEALKGLMTHNEITNKYHVHDTQIKKWKKQLKENMATIFTEKVPKQISELELLVEELYKQIGQQKVELDWLKKKS